MFNGGVWTIPPTMMSYTGLIVMLVEFSFFLQLSNSSYKFLLFKRFTPISYSLHLLMCVSYRDQILLDFVVAPCATWQKPPFVICSQQAFMKQKSEKIPFLNPDHDALWQLLLTKTSLPTALVQFSCCLSFQPE